MRSLVSPHCMGQALSYKLGQLQISEVRKRAQKKLGANFDIRTFS